MAKPEQVLIIEPQHELTFIGPFTNAVSAVMTLRNPSDRKVCFKIKTTAPKRYCVKPNSGVISAKETVQVAVSLQPFDYDPQEKNRHKFMVQAMYAPEGDFNSDSLWKDTPADQLMDSKLKCVFLLPEGSGVTNGASTTSSNAATSVVENSKQEFHHSVSTTSSIKSSSPKVTYSDVGDSTEKSSDSLKRSVDEIKRLNEEISSLRQENLQLREEYLREKRLASARSNDPSSSSSSSSLRGSDAFTVQARSPDETALSTTYIYAALFILVIGIIIGKWIF
jgi:hypothetical protein